MQCGFSRLVSDHRKAFRDQLGAGLVYRVGLGAVDALGLGKLYCQDQQKGRCKKSHFHLDFDFSLVNGDNFGKDNLTGSKNEELWNSLKKFNKNLSFSVTTTA